MLGGQHCNHFQNTANRHCRGVPMREVVSVPLIGSSHARALPHHCHITADWLEESLPNHCRRCPRGARQHCPHPPNTKKCLACRAPARRPCTLPRPPGCHRPSRARIRGVCAPGTARERASAREAGWVVSNRTAIASDAAAGQNIFPILSRVPAPARHKATGFPATCAAERARTCRPSSFARHPSPCRAGHRHQRVHSHLARVSPDK